MTDAQMTIPIAFGVEAIRNYKRMNYTYWHALAEFVDNSTQSYFDHREELDNAYTDEGLPRQLEVAIIYDRRAGEIRISDTAMGMSRAELERALVIGKPPLDPRGRCQYGMGMKTAATWMGNIWEVRTKKLGATEEFVLTIDVEKVADGGINLPVEPRGGQDPTRHYTILSIRALNAKPQTRTLRKIREFLRSMYREDLRTGTLKLEWDGEELKWDPSEWRFQRMPGGGEYFKELDFPIETGRRVRGWVGVLERGSRAKAGFSMLHSGRVVMGWPDAWRPEVIFGQPGGSNNLINQRLIGEIRLDDFDVTHTKDGIVWGTEEEEAVEEGIKERVQDLIERAAKPRKSAEDSRGPSDLDVQSVVEEVQEELTSAEMVDLLEIKRVPPTEVVKAEFEPLAASVEGRAASFSANVGPLLVSGYVAYDVSPNDPYLYVDSNAGDRVEIVVNMSHPCIRFLDRNGFASHLRHCVYDGIAEWQARKVARLDSDTIKKLKDQLLRLTLEIEQHEIAAEEAAAEISG